MKGKESRCDLQGMWQNMNRFFLLTAPSGNTLTCFFFFFKGPAPPRVLPSSPPRPSSDLTLAQHPLPELMDENARRSDPLEAREVTIEAMVQSAMRSAALAEECGLAHDRIILSAKVSGVQDLVAVHRPSAGRRDLPRHLRRVLAGGGGKGSNADTAGRALLLQ